MDSFIKVSLECFIVLASILGVTGLIANLVFAVLQIQDSALVMSIKLLALFITLIFFGSDIATGFIEAFQYLMIDVF